MPSRDTRFTKITIDRFPLRNARDLQAFRSAIFAAWVELNKEQQVAA